MAKRQTSAKTRVKLSQAAKKRRRGLKGTSLGGKFAAGFGASAGPKSKGVKIGVRPIGPSRRQEANDYHNAVRAGEIDPVTQAWHGVRSREMGDQGPKLKRSDLQDIETPPPVGIRKSDVRANLRSRREQNWQTASGLYEHEAAKKGKFIPASTFIEKELPEGHREWIRQQLKDPTSAFSEGLQMDSEGQVLNKTKGAYAPGQRNRVRLYTETLQQGGSHADAMARLQGERRGRKGTGKKPRTGLEPQYNVKGGRRSRYETVAPRPGEFNVGVSARSVDSLDKLKSKLPEHTSEKELVRTQQFQRQYLGDEILKNQTWTHETKRANLMGGAIHEDTPDRVVFFTTNLGGPAPTVASDSLVGQYIIRRRKSMLKGSVNPKDLKGEFPRAVRDQHIIEASTGLSFGAEGRWGAFQKSGWRKGKKTSPNFGKPQPIGSQVIYDSQGRPTYDKQGNVVFSEGATRPFRFETMKDAGLRVFIG